MKKEMLINVLQSEECRIGIVEDGVLEELYVERSSQESYVGNIYKGRIVNIEPSIQAAFVDFGIGRNGFLHISDVDPAYYKHLLSREALAEYEAELEREHSPNIGGGGNGDRDRNNRGRGRGPRNDRPPGNRDQNRDAPAPEVSSWLEPQPVIHSVPEPEPDHTTEELDDFAAGLDNELPVAEEVAAEANSEVEAASASVEDNDDFGARVIDEPEPQMVVAPAIAPQPPLPIQPKITTADDADEFGAGLFDDEPTVEPTAPSAVAPIATVSETPEALEPHDLVESEAGESAEEPKTRKPRTRKAKPKTDEPASEAKAEEVESEGKGKAKVRRTRKKADGEGDTDGDIPPDAGPKFMGGAERRTSGDDEPEIAPFFEGGDDFDPDAPNDRFGETSEAPQEPEGGLDAEETEQGFQESDENVQDESEPEPTPVPSGRGFNDDFEDSRPPRNDRDRGRGAPRGDRDRGGRSGDRGPRNDRDRGPSGRGDRDRGPGRGPGGPGRGPGGQSGPGGPKGGRDRGFPKPPIQEVFKRGQEVIVQVIKEGIGTKGPTLSTYISIAGRYLVLMPSLNRVGVSRKIEDHDARKRLREIMSTLTPPKGVGFIVRTAAIDRDAQELQNDLAYLLRLWQVVVKRIKRVNAPVEIYRESDMITRTIRDIFTSDIDTIWVDEEQAFSQASEFLQIVMPRYANRIRYFNETEPLFHRYGIEEEIARIHQKRLEMPLGGSIIIEQTEALVAIDVNSGNFRADNNAEETAYQMNLLAAKEIARQLRLRDLGGVIVNDFIDMRSEVHRRNVEKALRDAMRRDRARTKILRISQFGLIEMTRQRIRPSLKRSIFADCSHCRATGYVKTNESMSIEVMRQLQLAAHRKGGVQSIEVTVHMDVAHYLLNKKRREIVRLQELGQMEVRIVGQVGGSPETCTIKCHDGNGNEVRLLPPSPPRLSGGRTPVGAGPGTPGGPRGNDRRYPRPLE